MSAQTLMGSLPRHVDTGIDDKSIPVPEASMEVFPVHLPIFFIKAARGSYDAILYTTYEDAINQLGAETFDPTSEFFNHQTLYVLETLAAGNACMIKRIDVGAESAGSTLIAIVEQVANIHPTYRDGSGVPITSPFFKYTYRKAKTTPEEFSLDDDNFDPTAFNSGDIIRCLNSKNASNGWMWKIVITTTEAGDTISYERYTTNVESGITLSGYRVTLKVIETEISEDAVITQTIPGKKGSDPDILTLSAGETAYPVMHLKAQEGSYGNSTGYRFWSAAPGQINDADSDVMSIADAFIYNIQFVKKLATGQVVTIQSLYGDIITQFTFKPDVINYKTNEKLNSSNVITRYADDGRTTGAVKIAGPADSVRIYRTSIDTLSALLMEKENDNRDLLQGHENSSVYPGPSISPNAYATLITGSNVTSKNLINFINGIDIYGVEYYGFYIRTTGAGVINASKNKTIYLGGGTDGDLTDVTISGNDPADLTAYETSVIELLDQVEDAQVPLIESAKYPFTHIYDSGFSVLTKKALLRWLDIRPSVYVTISVLRDGEGVLSTSAELSRGLVLANEAKLHMESATWGTPTCRATVVMQSGTMANERYSKRVSLSIDLLIKRARYMGAGDGFLKKEYAYDVYPNNIVSALTDVSLPYLNTVSKAKAWSNGLVYAQAFDSHQMFYPAFHTVYENESSVLTGEIFVQICCDVKNQAEKIWRMFTGRSDLNNEQFIKNTTKAMEKLVKGGKYTKRVIVESQAIITAADDNRGNTWQMKNTVYGNVAKTVQQATIVAKRMP